MSKIETITFKVDSNLAKFLKEIPNKSEFIRNAILKSMDNVCPLCNGFGFLTDSQLEHWKNFEKHHYVKKCEKCNEKYMACDHEEEKNE